MKQLINETYYKKEKEEVDGILNAAKHIIDLEDEKDVHLMKEMDVGTYNEITNLINTKVNNYNDMSMKQIVTTDMIKKVCLNYNLRFLPISYYVGPLPKKILSEIRQFIKENQLINISNKFYIIAPVSMISTKETDILSIPGGDPAILFKISDDKYKFITSFGDDLTWKNRLSGFFNMYIKRILEPVFFTKSSMFISFLLTVALSLIITLSPDEKMFALIFLWSFLFLIYMALSRFVYKNQSLIFENPTDKDKLKRCFLHNRYINFWNTNCIWKKWWN